MPPCDNCGRECIKHAKGMCVTCYKKLVWKQKPYKCKKCGRMLFHHAKGMCGGCYNTTFHLEYTKNRNYEKYHNISPELYRKITSKCLICGFEKVTDLHHLDKNRKNNSEDNMIGLCPNHHRMIHMQEFRDEIRKKIDFDLVKQFKNSLEDVKTGKIKRVA